MTKRTPNDLDAEPARKTRSVAFNPLRGRIEEVYPEDEVPAEDLIQQHWSETLQRWVTIPEDDAAGDRVIFTRDEIGWMKCIVAGHYCTAKVTVQPSERYGLFGGRIIKLTISSGDSWQGLDDCLLNYDRDMDFDHTPPGLLERVAAFVEAHAG
jgi:hypothetical protein